MQQIPPRQNQPNPQKPADARTIVGKLGPLMQSEKHDKFIGKTFAGNTSNKYLITEKISAGGMGVVYKATVGTHTVALKVFGQDLLSAPEEDVKRFTREALIMERISHPNVVRLFDFGTSENYMFLVMEYLKGRSLHDILAPKNVNLQVSVQPAKWDFARSVILQSLAGIQAAHVLGIWHRDIKPSNIYVLDSGQVKLIDFGTAKSNQPDLTTLTQSGVAVGTFHFMSTETLQCERPDHRVDIYGTGAVLYWLLSGHLPYSANNIAALVGKIVGAEGPARLSDLVPQRGIPTSLEDIVFCALAKKRDDRFHSALEMADAIREVDWDGQPKADMTFVSFNPKRSLARRIASFAFKIVLPVSIAIGAIWAVINQDKAMSIYDKKAVPFYNSRIAPALEGFGIYSRLPTVGTPETTSVQKQVPVPVQHHKKQPRNQVTPQYFPDSSGQEVQEQMPDTITDTIQQY